MLLGNKRDDVNRNIRDLGVLPEEAFQKYIDVNLDRVTVLFQSVRLQLIGLLRVAGQEATKSQRRPQEVRPRQQEGV